MKPIHTPRLILRNWEDRDRALFHRINSDDQVMAFFPFRRNRTESDAVMDRMRAETDANGFGWTAAELKVNGACIGFVGLNIAKLEPVLPAGCMEIGWRLAPEYWGKGYVSEAASALLDFAFDDLGRAEIVSFAVLGNTRSTAVMERLGMVRGEDFDYPGLAETRPDLQRHAFYRITREQWTRKKRL